MANQAEKPRLSWSSVRMSPARTTPVVVGNLVRGVVISANNIFERAGNCHGGLQQKKRQPHSATSRSNVCVVASNDDVVSR